LRESDLRPSLSNVACIRASRLCCANREEDKAPIQKRLYEKRMRENARKRLKSALESTVQESQRIGHARSDGLSAFEMLEHASHGADLDTPENKSLFLFKLNNPFRLWAAKAQASSTFSNGVTCLILFSCVTLALEGPGEGSTGWAQENFGPILGFVDAAVLLCFVFEALLKCVVHGFALVSGPTRPYLSTTSNRVDASIILLCLISYVDMLPLNGAAARALRVGRVITPMVNLAKHPSIKLVFVSFARAGPDTAVVLLPLAILGLIFGIVGVANFGSAFKRCVSAAEPLVALHDNRTLCNYDTGAIWASPPFHFDDVPHAIATLFTALTDGAHGFMLNTLDQGSASAYAYWISFHLVFTCFFLNLFIGVLSASFEKSSGTSLRTLGEKQWGAVQFTISQFRPRKSETEELGPNREQNTCCRVIPIPLLWHKMREATFVAATNSRLDSFWRLAIVVNTLILATDRYPRTEAHETVIAACNDFFLGICAIEVVIKLVGLGPAYFFSHGWLVSDLLLVAVSISFKLLGVQSGVEVLRMMRVFRLLVLFAKIPDLATLIETLVRCINASFALLFITALIIYLYAIIGMTVFGRLPETSRLEASHVTSESQEYDLRKAEMIVAHVCPDCTSYTDVTNFSSFFTACKLLVQCAFGQAIGGFITDMQFLGADFWLLFTYFGTFYGVCVWVCFNLLIVTVLDNFDAAIPPEMDNTLTPEDMDGFAHCWAALTIGTHSCEAVEATSEAVLQRLSTTLEQEAEDMLRDFDPPNNVEIETGEPLGMLTIRVQQIDGLGEADVKPFCLITARSTLVCGEEFTETLSQEVENGSAIWPEGGAESQVQITSNHTHLDFDIRNSFQFSNDRVGGCSVSLEEILKLCGNEMQKSERKELSDESRTIVVPLMVDSRAHAPEIHGEDDRWDRHVHLQHLSEDGTLLEDPAEEEIVEDDLDDTNAVIPGPSLEKSNDQEIDLTKEDPIATPETNLTKEEKKQKKREEKLRQKEQKRLHKAEKKAAKKARKDAKRAAKQAKKQAQKDIDTAKKTGKIRPPEPEPEPEPPPHKFYAEGWVESGATLQLVFEFRRKMMAKQSTNFMRDYIVRYPQKEQNCGVEGWLELSENDGRFHKRFCYIQRYPVPCFKIVQHAATISAVESLATRGVLEVHAIKGEQILTLTDRDESKSSEDQETSIHVRNIGDVCQTEDELRVVFSKYGHFVRAMVRIRYDDDGNNTSWALVTLGTAEAAKKALRAEVVVHKDGIEKTLNINPFSKKQAAASSGGMKTISASIRHFQLFTSEPTGSGKKEEVQIGIISGTIISATGLKPTESSAGNLGVALVELLDLNELLKERTDPEKLDGITVDGDSEPDGEMESDMGKDPDEVDQQKCETQQYVAVTGVTVRKHADLRSPKIGVIKRGQIAAVTHSKQLDSGILRLRCAAGGWVSACTVAGKVHMVPKSGAGRFYRIVSKTAVQIGEHIEVGKCTEAVGRLEKHTVVEALETATDPSTQQMRIRVKTGWISEIDFDLVATPDPFCVIDSVPVEDAGARQATRVEQQAKTPVQEDNLQPHWNHAFDIKLYPSSGSLSLSVRNAQRKSEVMGSATISLVDEDGIPGAVLTSAALSTPTFEMSTDPSQVTVELTGAEGVPAGAVTLLLAYAPMVSRKVLSSARDAYGDNWRAELMVDETMERQYKIRNMTEERRRAWLAALRWTALGCPGYPATPPSSLPVAPILKTELERVTRDISLLTLPFRRATMLLNGLYGRRVMGNHKPRFRRTAYTIFNLELHAWSDARGHVSQKDHPFIGVPLRDLRGLNFHTCMERLCLLHYGKQRCLSFDEQMLEYTTEVQHISLHMIHACLGQWLARRRIGSTVGGELWPWFEPWRLHPTIFVQAAKGAFYSRMRTLRVLRKEVERHSRPTLFGELPPPSERSDPKVMGNQCGCCAGTKSQHDLHSSQAGLLLTREHFLDIRLEDFIDGSGGATVDGEALRSALMTSLALGTDRNATDWPPETSLATEIDRIAGLATATGRILSTDEWVTAVLDSSPLAFHEDDEDSDLDDLAKSPEQLEAELFSPINE
jgi:hypothetical protein